MTTKSTVDETPKGERLAKCIARAGICSRRDAEKLIEAGKVKVNNKTIHTPAFNVSPEDEVIVEGKPLAQKEATRLWLYHKPTGLITTHRDPEGRKTVFEALPPGLPRVLSVGRLDINSEGLLLLTNDGALARHIELPATGWVRRYRVRLFGTPTPQMIQRLAKGITVDDIRYGSMEVTVDREGSNTWIMVGLREGKNREIRKVFEHLGFQVSRLLRVAYGPFQLGNLPSGQIKEVPRKMLKEQLGDSLPL